MIRRFRFTGFQEQEREVVRLVEAGGRPARLGDRLLASSRAMIRTIGDDPEVLRAKYRKWLDVLITELRKRTSVE